jgi:hypothetical protein
MSLNSYITYKNGLPIPMHISLNMNNVEYDINLKTMERYYDHNINALT